MNQITLFGGASNAGAEVLTMTSREIADLVESRHDNVKTSIERLAEKGIIRKPAMQETEEINNLGLPRKVSVYVFSGKQGKRDSIVVVAQLSPEFTARLVDRWQELEAQVAAPTPSVEQDPEVARLVAMRDSGLMSQTVCEIAAFRLLGIIHPSEDRVNDPAPAAPEEQPDASSDSQEAIPYFLRIEYEQNRRGRRVKSRPKFAGTPTPLILTAKGRDLVKGYDTPDLGMTALGLGAFVVGGYVEVRRALYEFDIDTITGEVTVNGARFSAGGRLRGMQCWKAAKLLRHLSGMK